MSAPSLTAQRVLATLADGPLTVAEIADQAMLPVALVRDALPKLVQPNLGVEQGPPFTGALGLVVSAGDERWRILAQPTGANGTESA